MDLLFVAFFSAAAGLLVGMFTRPNRQQQDGQVITDWKPPQSQVVVEIPVEILGEEDVLVVQTDKHLSSVQAGHLRTALIDALKGEPGKVLVLDAGLRLSVLRRAAA